jgi:hypothetical protein
MSEERGLATDQLSNIIQVIELGRKSGQLIVERGEGQMVENGEITFFHGQITYARCNYHSGQEALRQLNTWGACRFMFTPVSTGTTIVTGPRPLPLTGNPKSTRPLYALPHPHETPRYTPLQSTRTQQAIAPSIPQRTIFGDKALHLLDQAGLSRFHLRLFLLIDGKRTVDELTRLVGKKHEDVRKWLLDLESTGLIHQGRP